MRSDAHSPSAAPVRSDDDDLRFDRLVAGFVDAPNAVTRSWLHTLVDDRLARPGCRYLLLTGETGSGKTAFMAAVARKHPEWLRYFIRADSTTPLSSGDTVSVMLRVGHQLAAIEPRAFDPERLEIVVKQRIGQAGASADLAGVRIGDLRASPFLRTAIHVEQNIQTVGGRLTGVEILQATLEPRILEPTTLSHLALFDPAAAIARMDSTRLIVILIDAIDELATLTGASSVLDWLETSAELPANVRIVLTSRPGAHLDAFRAARGSAIQEVTLDDRSAHVLDDTRAFTTRLFGEVEATHAGAVPDGDRAVTALATAAQGNFAYLTAYERALLTALAAGDMDSVEELIAFEALPIGLDHLYTRFVARLRRQVDRLGPLDVAKRRMPEDRFVLAWNGAAQQLLGVLAVARAPVTLDQMMTLGDVRIFPSGAGEVLRCFLPLLEEANGAYAFFHTSFRDYLTKSADAVVNPVEWHQRIVAFYRGGRPWEKVNWSKTDDYGLLYAGEHAAAASEDLTGLLSRGLRIACHERFYSDLPFRRVVELVRARSAGDDSLVKAVTDAIFCELLVAGITSTANLDPPVFGLMARLGRAREALDRAEILPPDINKFRAIEAIRACTPAGDREILGLNDGVERLVAVAYDTPEVSATDLFGGDAVSCLGDAAATLAPFDLDRALRVIARRDKLRSHAGSSDAAMVAVARAAPPDRALGLLDRLGRDVATVAIDFAEREGDPMERAVWIARADSHLPGLPLLRRMTQIARIAALEAEDKPAQRKRLDGIRMLLKSRGNEEDEDGFDAGYALCETAKVVHPFDADLAEALITAVEAAGPDDPFSDYGLQNAAEVRINWGQPDKARALIERILIEYRSRGWWGPAEHIAKAAQIVASFDPIWSKELADEADAMIEPVLRDPSLDNTARLDVVVEAMAEAYRAIDPLRALRLARLNKGGPRARNAQWQEMGGTGGIAMIGLDMADRDPAGASALLDECLASDGSARFGRAAMVSDHAGLFRIENGRAGGNILAMASAMNYASYWIKGRDWRIFEAPADVLRSVADALPSGASWGQAIAAALGAAARTDPEGALAIAGRLGDPTDRLVGLAGIVRALASFADDELFQKIAFLTVSTAKRQPTYRPEIDLNQHPQAPVFQYLDPTSRARFEAAVMLAPLGEQPARMLIEGAGSLYLGLVWQVCAAAENCLASLAHNKTLAPEERDGFLALMRSVAATDPLLADVARCCVACSALVADRDAASVIAAEIDHLGYRMVAEKQQVPAVVSAGTSPLHVAWLATRWAMEPGDDTADVTANTAIRSGVVALTDADPLQRVHGLILLAGVAPTNQGLSLLEQALRESNDIGNVYLRSDALCDMMGVACRQKNSALLTRVIGRLAQTGWWQLVAALRRCLDVLVSDHGIGIIDAIDEAIRRAAAVIDQGPAEYEHLDGVWPRGRGTDLVADANRPAPTPGQLALYLGPGDLPSTLQMVQDERDRGPDPDDDQFNALGGLHSGFCIWLAEHDQSLWRVVDIRFVFPDDAAAALYHRKRLAQNSESMPPVPDAPLVGQECQVFGGKIRGDLGGQQFEITNYIYVYRVGRVVVKLFAAQGMQASQPLLPAGIVPTAERIVELIKANALGS